MNTNEKIALCPNARMAALIVDDALTFDAAVLIAVVSCAVAIFAFEAAVLKRSPKVVPVVPLVMLACAAVAYASAVVVTSSAGIVTTYEEETVALANIRPRRREVHVTNAHDD